MKILSHYSSSQVHGLAILNAEQRVHVYKLFINNMQFGTFYECTCMM